MAADLKAVGSTAADQEEHSQKVVRNVHLTATESRSEKDLAEVSAKAEKGSHSVTDRAEALARAARENLSQATGRADHSAKAVKESHSQVKESRSVTDRAEVSAKEEKGSHSQEKEGHSETGHAEASERVVKENHSLEKEDHSAETGKDSAEREDLSEPRRASTRRISTISAMRRRAASTR